MTDVNPTDVQSVMAGAAEEAAELFAQMAQDPGAGVQGPAQTPGGEQQQGQQPATPPGDTTGETGASDEGTPTSTKAEGEKPPPYDQDPKWKAAREAERTLNTLLEEHGYTNVDDLKTALKTGTDAEKLLRGEDPEQVLKDAQEFRRLQQEREEEEARRLEEDELPEETVERLRKENQRLKSEREKQARAAADEQRSAQVLERYQRMVTDLVDKMDLGSKPERNLTLRLLGVENPIDALDIDDRQAVAQALREESPRIQEMIKAIRQHAVDEYAAGKSKLVPGSSHKQAPPAQAAPPPASQEKGKGTERPPVATDITAEFDDIKSEMTSELKRLLSQATVHQG
jgi:hypothetical protein